MTWSRSICRATRVSYTIAGMRQRTSPSIDWTRRSALALSLVALALLVTGGCAKPEKAPTKPKVALIMKSLANEFFHTMENGAKAHQIAHAGEYELISIGIKDELDVGRQIDLVDQMITAKVDAIIIAPADSKALGYVCRKALDAKIVVVNIDNKLDASVLAEKNLSVPFVGPTTARAPACQARRSRRP